MIRIALAQVNTTVGDFERNRGTLLQYIKRARSVSADVVVFPELALTGYPPEDLLLKRHFVQDNKRVLNALIKETANITAVVGFVDADRNSRLFNAAAVIYNRRLIGVYRKACLPNYGVFDEKRYFAPGEDNCVFTLGEAVLGVSICEDIWTLDGPCVGQRRAGAQVLINLSSSPYHAGKGRERKKILVQQAKKNKLFVCYANLVGGQDELVFDGGSCIIDPKGKVIAAGKQFEEDLVVADIDPLKKATASKVSRTRKLIISKEYQRQGRIPVKGRVPAPLGRLEEIYKALVLGTCDYVRKNGFKKVIIGLSGGIDSALTALVACDAIGKENVTGVSMPSQFSSEGTKNDARVLAKNLGIDFIEIPIQEIFQVYLKVLGPHFKSQAPDAAEENLQARIRGNILMALSNKFGWLVLTTGNKSEVAVGYCTLYGDMAGGFSVIKDVLKTTVVALARFRNEQAPEPVIPQTIIQRPPSAELRENQKDEDSLPAYPVLDSILKGYVELDKSLLDLNREWDHDLLVKVIEMVDKNEYKRRQAPPGIKITPKAFGRDRRCPITNRYKEY